MNLSLQATGRDIPRDDNYPWRATVLWVADCGLSQRLQVFECATDEDAHLVAAEAIGDYDFDSGVMHYYVGEVA